MQEASGLGSRAASQNDAPRAIGFRVHRRESVFDALRGYACAPQLVADPSVARPPFRQ